MVDITYIDHVTAGLSLLPSQWEDKPVINGVLAAWLTPINETEQNALDVRDGFNINTAVGAQLDIIGEYFNEPRAGRSDEEYRNAILSIIASSNGSGTPSDLINLYQSLTSSESVKIWEHYPLSVALLSTGGDDVNIQIPSYMENASAAAVEFVGMMYDPYGHVWLGNESAFAEAFLITNNESNLINENNDAFLVDAVFEAIDNGTFRSSFVDISIDEPSGWGELYGQNWGGSPEVYSQLCECALTDNSLVVNGGNGFIPWATLAELDPETGTTNKAKPIKQFQDSGLKRGQPIPRMFFNWMMASIDDWLNWNSLKNPVGSIQMRDELKTDVATTIADYQTRFGGTWSYVGVDVTMVTSGDTVYVFERTA